MGTTFCQDLFGVYRNNHFYFSLAIKEYIFHRTLFSDVLLGFLTSVFKNKTA